MPGHKTAETAPPFLQHLYELDDREDRGALAGLRRSLVADNVTLAFRHVLPWLSRDTQGWRESAALLLAGLFATHPQRATDVNFGWTMRQIWERQDKSRSTEQRFVALLDVHHEDLHYLLRQAVSLARAYDVPIDWEQLYSDICNWTDSKRYVQRSWARSFWTA
jgi:CRISPR system Cascade subunit CasB